MKRLLVLLGAVAILAMGTASTIQCPVFVRPQPTTITIEVLNDTPVGLQATFAVSPDPDITQDELLSTGDLFSLTVGSGLVDAFDLDCDEAQALILDRADLLVTDGGGVGTNILYLDLDYFCGEIITFDFTASEDLTVLDVDVSFTQQ